MCVCRFALKPKVKNSVWLVRVKSNLLGYTDEDGR